MSVAKYQYLDVTGITTKYHLDVLHSFVIEDAISLIESGDPDYCGIVHKSWDTTSKKVSLLPLSMCVEEDPQFMVIAINSEDIYRTGSTLAMSQSRLDNWSLLLQHGGPYFKFMIVGQGPLLLVWMEQQMKFRNKLLLQQ